MLRLFLSMQRLFFPLPVCFSLTPQHVTMRKIVSLCAARGMWQVSKAKGVGIQYANMCSCDTVEQEMVMSNVLTATSSDLPNATVAHAAPTGLGLPNRGAASNVSRQKSAFEHEDGSPSLR